MAIMKNTLKPGDYITHQGRQESVISITQTNWLEISGSYNLVSHEEVFPAQVYDLISDYRFQNRATQKARRAALRGFGYPITQAKADRPELFTLEISE